MKTADPGIVPAFALVALLLSAVSSTAAPPVPFYPSNVSKLAKVSAGSVVITTRDSVATVCAWYRKNLHDQNGEATTEDSAHIFYTHNGATVSVEPGSRFAPDTSIGLVWNAKKFGAYK